MTNIFLRTFKTKDIKMIEECMSKEAIPTTCLYEGGTAGNLLEDYMSYDQKEEIALAIADQETDECLGVISAFAVGEELYVEYYVSPDKQKKESQQRIGKVCGICTNSHICVVSHSRY